MPQTKIRLLGDGVSAYCDTCEKVMRASSSLVTIAEVISSHQCESKK